MIDYNKRLKCIAIMPERLQQNFDEMVQFYGAKLSNRIIDSGAAYTYHDFKIHCCNIYKIISNVLLADDTPYNDEVGLSDREWYILNLAVLFHDISMSASLTSSRENHSLESVRYLKREWSGHKLFKSESELTQNETKALYAIIVAHSNVKTSEVPESENGLYSKYLVNQVGSDGRDIRTKFLAGILRVADELDITTDRLGTEDLLEEIESAQEEVKRLEQRQMSEEEEKKHKKLLGYCNSLNHWKKLYYISAVKKSADNSKIEIVIDDDYIERLLDEGNTHDSIADVIVDIYNTVNEKFEEAKKLAFTADVRKYITVDKIELCTDDSKLKETCFKKLNIRDISQTKKKTVKMN